jgi:hypothetical protein
MDKEEPVESQFDVFLSYNTKDQPSVQQIAERLRGYEIDVWFDDWEIKPGTSFQTSIDRAIRQSRSIAIFISDANLGPWQTREVESAISVQVGHGIPAIPILLPGAVINSLPLFLQTSRYIDFRDSLDDSDAMRNLRWGITGKKPPREKLSAPIVDQPETSLKEDPVEEAISDLVQILKTQNITFFLGPGASYGANPMPAQASDIARDLLTELKIIEANYSELLPPADVAGLYYGVRSGDWILERKVTSRLADRSKVFPKTYDRLADLLKLLKKRPPLRTGGRNLQLIVTTNLDLMAERALLRAGLPFTRIVQYRSGKQLSVDEYKQVQLFGDHSVQLIDHTGNLQQAQLTDFDELDRLIGSSQTRRFSLEQNVGESLEPLSSLKFNELTEPILYKFLGSQDMTNSCVLSTLHHFEFARTVLSKGLPDELTSIIRNSTILFLGLWFMDPDFRLTYYTLLRDALRVENDRRYALQLPPQRFMEDVYRRMERGIWDKIKEAGVRQMGITAIEERCDIFLAQLHQRIKTELRLEA